MAKLHTFIYRTCCNTCIKLCAKPRSLKALNHIPPSKGICSSSEGQTLLYANKDYQYANKQFQRYLSKTKQDEEHQFWVTAGPIFKIMLCVSVQLLSPRPQPVLRGGHGEGRLHHAGPSWPLGCLCENTFNKG